MLASCDTRLNKIAGFFATKQYNFISCSPSTLQTLLDGSQDSICSLLFMLTAKQSRLPTSQGCSRATRITAVATKWGGGVIPSGGWLLFEGGHLTRGYPRTY